MTGLVGRFRRSANIARDFGQPDALLGYIVSPMARELLFRLSSNLADPQGTRAFSIVGPYGTGKSSFLTFLAMLWDSLPHRKAAQECLARFYLSDVDKIDASLSAFSGGLIPVLVSGERGPIEPLLQKAIQETAKQEGVRVEGTPLEQVECLHHALIAKGYAGLLIILDECGKFLEAAAERKTDLFILQQLAEAASRAPGRLVLITVLHQNFEKYATSLTPTARNEWSKISGRFEDVVFQESTAHLVRLIADALPYVQEGTQQSLFAEASSQKLVQDLEKYLPVEMKVQTAQLARTWPLNPVTALCLGPIFRLGSGQNERSLFSFLGSQEPFGYQEFLKDPSHTYTLDRLYDYLNAQHSGARPRIWAAAEEALLRLHRDAEALDGRLVKAIALLQMVGAFNIETPLLSIVLDAPENKVKEAIKRLKEASILMYRRFKQSFQLWEGSDFDIETHLKEMRDKVRHEGISGRMIQEFFPPQPIVASRHYIQTGTLRYLSTRYVAASELSLESVGGRGDGELLLVIPQNESELEELRSQFEQKKSNKILALPGTLNDLVDRLIEFYALSRLQHETAELANDPVARREVEERQVASRDALATALIDAYGGTREKGGVCWYYKGQEIHVLDRPSAEASKIFDKLYTNCPYIFNELANRQVLSSAAASARRELLIRVLENADQPQLGIEGFPPELSLYRSILERTGLHTKKDGNWLIQDPKGDLSKTWKKISNMLLPGERIKSTSVIEKLGDPPFGIRAGLASILIGIWYIQHQKEVFIYEDNTFLPALSADALERWLKRPEGFELQRASSEATNTIYTGVARALSWPESTGNALGLSRQLVLTIRRLCSYTNQTRAVSEVAKRVRSAIKSARDPVRLLTHELPEALNVEATSADYGSKLHAALVELQLAEEKLLDQIENTLRDFLQGAPADALYVELIQRAKELKEMADQAPELARWVELTKALDPRSKDAQREWLSGVGTAVIGKPPASWTDADAQQFTHGAMELCRKLLSAEALSLTKGRRKEIKDFHLIQVSILDSQGNDRAGVAVLHPKDTELAGIFLEEVQALAQKHGLDRESMAWAVISGLMQQFSERA